MTDIVLIASSLDGGSPRVAAAGVAVARRLVARVAAVHALERTPPLPAVAAAPPDALLRRLRRKLAAELRAAGAGEGEVVEASVTMDRPGAGIAAAIRRHRPVLVVMGASRGLGAKMLGSTAERLLDALPCPLLLVRGEPRVPPRRVLAAVDLSALSADSLRVGRELLERVVQGPWELRALTVEENEEGGGKLRQAALDSLVAGAGGDGGGASVVTAIRRGEVVEAILDEAKECSADLLLLGTHGRGGLGRLRAGRVASRVARRSAGSVLLVPPLASLQRALADAVIEETQPFAMQRRHGRSRARSRGSSRPYTSR